MFHNGPLHGRSLWISNSLDASSLLRLSIRKLNASCFTGLQQICKYQAGSTLIFTDLMQLDEANGLDAT